MPVRPRVRYRMRFSLGHGRGLARRGRGAHPKPKRNTIPETLYGTKLRFASERRDGAARPRQARSYSASSLGVARNSLAMRPMVMSPGWMVSVGVAVAIGLT